MSDPAACAAVRARLLEGADLAEVRRTEGTHLERCAGCRAALARVETGIAALAVAIDAIRPELAAEAAVALVKRGGGGGTARGRRPARAAGPAVALAAVILAIVWAGPWRPGSGGVRPPPEALVAGTRAGGSIPTARGLSVDVPEAAGVAVFATRDPDIHVVWFYETRGSIEGDER